MIGKVLVVSVLGAIVVAGSAMAQVSVVEKGPYEQAGKDVALPGVIEEFLGLASMFYDHDADAFGDFCHEYGIDPSWASAAALGRAGRELEEEYLRRVKEAYLEGKAVDQDPNEWKPREIGRLVADLHGQLRTDGLPWNLRQFVLLIETKMRPKLTQYSDRPFAVEDLTVPTELFLEGVAAVSSEGAELAAERRER